MFHRSIRSLKWLRTSGFAVLALMLLVGLLAACGSNSDAGNKTITAGQEEAAQTEAATPEASEEAAPDTSATRIVTDELDHEIEIPTKPLRVFAPYMEDSLISLGVKPVAQWANGEAGQEYLKEHLQDVPKADFAGGLPPSPEVVMAFGPDLIILHTAFYAENGVYENYSKIAPTYVFKNAAGDLESSVTKLGDLLGKSAEAKQALQDYHQKIDEAKAKLAPVTEGKNAALINFNGKGMYLIGGNYFGGYVLSQELGIGQSKLVAGKNSADVSLEVIPDIDADFIFTINYRGTGTANLKQLTESNIWKSTAAAKNNQVYEVNDEYWTGGGLIAYGKIIDDIVGLLAP